jgi:hypothetical protein
MGFVLVKAAAPRGLVQFRKIRKPIPPTLAPRQRRFCVSAGRTGTAETVPECETRPRLGNSPTIWQALKQKDDLEG